MSQRQSDKQNTSDNAARSPDSNQERNRRVPPVTSSIAGIPQQIPTVYATSGVLPIYGLNHQVPNYFPGSIPRPPANIPRGIMYGQPAPLQRSAGGLYEMNPHYNPYLRPQPSTSGLVRSPMRQNAHPDSSSSAFPVLPSTSSSGPSGDTGRNDAGGEQEVHSTSANNYSFPAPSTSRYFGRNAFAIPVITTSGNIRGNPRGLPQFRKGATVCNKIRRRYPEPAVDYRKPSRRRTQRGVLFIKNLRVTMDDAEVRSIFGVYGTILDVAVHYDKDGNSLGTADVIFADIRDAVRAKDGLSGIYSRGMIISIIRDD